MAIVGAGALGQAYSAGLAAAGVRVRLIAREASAASLRAAGAIRTTGVFARRVPLADHDAPATVRVITGTQIPVVVGLIFATKGNDLRSAAGVFASSDVSWVMGLQNGVTKEDVLGEIFGRDRVVGEVGTLAAERRADGEVLVTNLGCTFVGEPAGGPSERTGLLAETLTSGGIPAEATSDVRSAEWSKLVNVAGTFGVDLLARSVWGTSMEDPNLGRAFLALLREAAAVAHAEGVQIRDLPGIPSATYLSQPDEASLAFRADRAQKVRAAGGVLDRRSSILQDLIGERPLEADFIFGDLIARAQRHGVAVPKLELVRDIARGIDPARHGRQSGG